MPSRRTIKKLLPMVAVAGVIAASALTGPMALLAGAVGYSYGYVGRLGGTLVGGPDAGTAGAGVQTFVVGTDYAVYYQTSSDGTTWSGWLKIPIGIATSNPGAVTSSTESDVFVRGTDNAVWQGSQIGSGGWGWASWGGVATSDPDATSIATGELDMVVRGTDNGLYLRQKMGTLLGAYQRIPNGVATSDAGLTSSATNEIDVFTRGTDNQLWFIKGTVASGWGTWTPLGGVLTSGPDAASCATGHMDVVVKGTDNAYWRRGSANGGTTWTAWQQLTTSTGNPGTWTSDPGVACVGGGNIDVFGRDTSNSLTYFVELPT
jgi:hypothetical protein